MFSDFSLKEKRAWNSGFVAGMGKRSSISNDDDDEYELPKRMWKNLSFLGKGLVVRRVDHWLF